MSLRLATRDGQVLLPVRAQPRASRSTVDGISPDGALRIRVQAPPVDGAANEALVRFVARELLGLAPSRVRLARGSTGRDKLLAIDAPLEQVQAALAPWLRD